MAQASSRKTGIYLTSALLVALAVAGGAMLQQLGNPGLAAGLVGFREAVAGAGLGAALAQAQQEGLLGWLLIPTAGPLVLAVLLLVVSPRSRGPAAEEEPAQPASSPADAGAGGLRLLAVLQEEARLLDFVREDLDDYGDEQVGAAARGIHASLRKAVGDRVEVIAILDGEDGDEVAVPGDFDPAMIRIVGTPVGDPPYQGILRHGGWRASDVRLPAPTPGSDPTILAPAEVEVEAG